MKNTGIVIAGLLLLLVAGCGVNQQYVDDQIAEAEARLDSKATAAEQKADANAAEIARFQTLAGQLSEKSDMAVNLAKGFENYQVIWSGVINFDFDSYMLTETAKSILDEAGQKMEQNQQALIEIAGHTDRTGTAKYNLMLGELRSNAAKRYLVDNFGTTLYRMFVVSHGKEKPIAMPDEKNAASKNRRVTLTVWGPMQ